MASGPGRAALPRAAPAATPFRAFKRADLATSELTKDDLVAAGKYTGNEPGMPACRYPKMLLHTNLFDIHQSCSIHQGKNHTHQGKWNASTET